MPFGKLRAMGSTGAMNWWTEGWREVARAIRRLLLQCRMRMAHRELADAETTLGTLAWQQADFFSPELQEQVNAIMAFEKDQAALLNREAELTSAIEQLEEEWENRRAELLRAVAEAAGAQQTLAAQEKQVSTAVAELPAHIEKCRLAQENTTRALAGLDPLAKKLESYDTSEARAELSRIPARRAALETERAELARALHSHERELASLRQRATALHAETAAAARELRAKQQTLETAEQEFARQRRLLARDRDQLRRLAASVEKKMQSPMRLVGECLADNLIAPHNQPGVLDRVRDARLAVIALDEEMASSQAESAQADRELLKQFRIIMSVAAAALILILAAVAM